MQGPINERCVQCWYRWGESPPPEEGFSGWKIALSKIGARGGWEARQQLHHITHGLARGIVNAQTPEDTPKTFKSRGFSSQRAGSKAGALLMSMYSSNTLPNLSNTIKTSLYKGAKRRALGGGDEGKQLALARANNSPTAANIV